jgi:hypothetical protein
MRLRRRHDQDSKTAESTPATSILGQLSSLAESGDTGGGESPIPPARAGRRRRVVALSTGALAIVGAGTVGALYATGVEMPLLPSRTPAAMGPATIELTDAAEMAGGKALLVTHGRADVAALRQALAGLSSDDVPAEAGFDPTAPSGDDTTLRLGVPVIVGADGRLDLHDTTVMLLSTADRYVGIEARGGRLDLRQATINSWDPSADGPDTNANDGRAWIMARDAGTLMVDSSTVTDLGYDEEGRHGLEWLAASGSMRTTTVSGNFDGVRITNASEVGVVASTIEHSLHNGVSLHGSRIITIRDSRSSNNGADGAAVDEKSVGVVIDDLHTSVNAQNGLLITGASSGVTVKGGDYSLNDQSGIMVTNAYKIKVDGVGVTRNETGIAVAASSNDVAIRSSRVSANRTAGVHFLSAGSVGRVEHSILDHNGSGVLVTDGNAVVGPKNEIVQNNVGINLLDSNPGLSVLRNDIAHNFGDGVFMVSTAGVKMDNNHVHDNEFAAFGVLESGLSAPFRQNNDVGPGRRSGWERVLQDFEARILTSQPPETPQYPVPQPLDYYSPIPKSRTGASGRGELPNPLTTPNNLTPDELAKAAQQVQKASGGGTDATAKAQATSPSTTTPSTVAPAVATPPAGASS